jgi:hypothetical protein
MKGILLTLFSFVIATKLCAQNKLIYEDENVQSLFFVDYTLRGSEDSCLLQYSNNQIISSGNTYGGDSHIYGNLLKEIQALLDVIAHDRVPAAEDMDIDTVVLKERFNRDLVQKEYGGWFLEPDSDACVYILKEYQSIDKLNEWLQKSYPSIDSGVFVINTAHDPRGIKIVIQTDMRTYYFDMRDIEIFQPYLMRTSDKDCLKFITNFNINKHIRNLFRALNVNRKIPWRDEVIESYILFCAEEYRL